MTPPPRSPDDERALQWAREKQHEASESRQQLQHEHATATERIEQLHAEIAILDKPRAAAKQAQTAQQLEFDSYANRIEAALAFAGSCEERDDLHTALETGAVLADALADYESEPERDEALNAMERCRKLLAKRWRKRVQDVVVDLRREFAVEIEDRFDEANPYSRGRLTAKVEGTTLIVRMRGNFEGRARHSQEQVDAWCERGDGLFTKITLENSHGTFSCRPDESPNQLIARLVEEAQGNPTWYVTGERPTPTMPEPLPPVAAEFEQRRTELITELGSLEAAATTHVERGSEIAAQEQQARATAATIESRDKSRVDTWRASKLEQARHVQLAGGALAGIGGAILLGTVGLWQSGVTGAKDAMPVVVGVSVPVLVTGLLLLTGGTVRKHRVEQLR